ncbi:MAG TPA: PQQ-binding-like beta-propeller repeat protein [Chloroflexota bacterium]|nr:PQQ-binding-like beta-propeller repeat protein [Chloroflexota bacterium]
MPATPPIAQTASADWTTYHRDLARTGVAVGPAVPASARGLWTSPQLDGDVYAEPLVVGSRLLVATEGDSLYALDAGDGHVLWRTHLGEPVPRAVMPCGNIDPVGITSTPVVDPAAGVLYAVAYLQPPHHELYAVDAATGDVRYHQPIDPPGADPLTHLQRASLTLSRGNVYVGFGGRFGDCGQYHGWVLAARASDGARVATYQVPTRREGAIWAPPGPTVDAAGNVWVATGNADSTEFDYGDAVIKLSPELRPLDWFAPSNWRELSARDLDLGSTSPVLLDGGLVFQVGKAGTGYLLKADDLGHEGGQAFSAPVCAGTGAYGGVAYAPPMLYVPCRSGLVALKVQGTSFSVVWTGPGFNTGSPVVAGDTVWVIDQSTGTLHGLGAADGQPRQQLRAAQPSNNLPHFITPTVVGGRIYVSGGKTIAAFG